MVLSFRLQAPLDGSVHARHQVRFKQAEQHSSEITRATSPIPSCTPSGAVAHESVKAGMTE